MSTKIPKIDTSSILTNKSRKSKSSKVSIQETRSQLEQVTGKDELPRSLRNDYIMIRGTDAEKLLNAEKSLIVPHSSPKSNIIFHKYVDTLPEKTNVIENLDIPYIRILGIRNTVKHIGEFFGCTLYKTSLLQFWFLDMVTDCLWKCQDEFTLNDQNQKCVLSWVLYVFNIIRDPLMNLSRGQLFRLFCEILTLAEDRIECGDPYFPKPEELFDVSLSPENTVEVDALLSDSTNSSLAFNSSESEHSFLVIPSEEYPDLPDFYKLPARPCKCTIFVSSSLETLSEKSLPGINTQSEESGLHYNSEDDMINIETPDSLSEFYQPNSRIHSRFLDEIDEEDDESKNIEELNKVLSELEYEWVSYSEKPILQAIEKPKSVGTLSSHDAASVHSSIRKIRSSSKSKAKPERRSSQEDTSSIQGIPMKKTKQKVPKQEKKLGEDELLKVWFEYNLWEQRKKDMEDPNKGWKPFEPELCAHDCNCDQIEYTSEDFENEEYLQIKNEWLQYLDKHKLAIDQNTQNVFINSCLLLMIKQFVVEYFLESFQYKLVKMAYQTVPNLTYEKLNNKWLVPKENKEEFKRPLEKKPKVSKPIKEKTPKVKKQKEREEKKSKSSKGSSKKEKQSKIKPEKPHKLTKEEKEEIERMKKEEMQKMFEEIAGEENRRFIFPLGLAANRDFFMSIFKDFSPPSEAKDKGKDKKNKKKK
ncbi:uncharacterized protein LOC123314441 [Coccinella septempunctata]|uniref:uncharacterized protein LOC123314441 n=1 Tax=Coccinella septempunctata TaxID=41139 RepID=UPI001D096D1B|nr:uncharacterized protein LOC123314441 [Coccinella septempunctata]